MPVPVVDIGGAVAVVVVGASSVLALVALSPIVPAALEGCNEVRADRVHMCICLQKGKRQIATWNTDKIKNKLSEKKRAVETSFENTFFAAN